MRRVVERPEIRASWTRRVLRHAEATDVATRAALREKLAPRTLARLENAGPLEWLPVEIHAELIHVVWDLMGKERYIALYSGMTYESLNRPLFGPLAKGAMSLFGRSAAGLERMFPRAWGLVSRGCGRLRLTSSRKGYAEMVLDGIPPILARTETYAMGFMGALDACANFAGTVGTTDPDLSELPAGRVTFRISWQE